MPQANWQLAYPVVPWSPRSRRWYRQDSSKRQLARKVFVAGDAEIVQILRAGFEHVHDASLESVGLLPFRRADDDDKRMPVLRHKLWNSFGGAFRHGGKALFGRLKLMGNHAARISHSVLSVQNICRLWPKATGTSASGPSCLPPTCQQSPQAAARQVRVVGGESEKDSESHNRLRIRGVSKQKREKPFEMSCARGGRGCVKFAGWWSFTITTTLSTIVASNHHGQFPRAGELRREIPPPEERSQAKESLKVKTSMASVLPRTVTWPSGCSQSGWPQAAAVRAAMTLSTL